MDKPFILYTDLLFKFQVLGLHNLPPPSATFDIESSDEERRKRASFIMIDSLKDLEGLLIGETIEENQQEEDEISGDSDMLDSSGYGFGFDGSPCTTPGSESLLSEVDSTAFKRSTNNSSIDQSGNPFNPFIAPDQNYPTSSQHFISSGGSAVDDLLNLDNAPSFDSGIVPSSDGKNLNAQTLPAVARKDDLLLDFGFEDPNVTSNPFNSSISEASNPKHNATKAPFVATEKSSSLDRAFADLKQPENFYFSTQPPDKTMSLNRSLSPDIASQQQNITHNRTNQASSSSLVSGLNQILQSSSAPSPKSLDSAFGFANVQEEKVEDFSRSLGSYSNDVPRSASTSSGSSDSKEAGGIHERGKPYQDGFVDSGFYADSELGSPPEQKFQSDTVVEMYKKQERRSFKKTFKISSDVKIDALQALKKSKPMDRTYTDVTEVEKRGRKKTSGAWLKDKIVHGKNKVVTGLRTTRAKSDGHQLKKAEGGKVYRNLASPENSSKPITVDEIPEKQESDTPPTITGWTARGNMSIVFISNIKRGS